MPSSARALTVAVADAFFCTVGAFGSFGAVESRTIASLPLRALFERLKCAIEADIEVVIVASLCAIGAFGRNDAFERTGIATLGGFALRIDDVAVIDAFFDVSVVAT